MLSCRSGDVPGKETCGLVLSAVLFCLPTSSLPFHARGGICTQCSHVCSALCVIFPGMQWHHFVVLLVSRQQQAKMSTSLSSAPVLPAPLLCCLFKLFAPFFIGSSISFWLCFERLLCFLYMSPSSDGHCANILSQFVTLHMLNACLPMVNFSYDQLYFKIRKAFHFDETFFHA